MFTKCLQLQITILLLVTNLASSFVAVVVPNNKAAFTHTPHRYRGQCNHHSSLSLSSTTNEQEIDTQQQEQQVEEEDEVKDFEEPEDAIINIQNRAMKHLRFLKDQQNIDTLILRMGVRNGGCSGLSYVMDYTTEDKINYDEDGDIVDVYPNDNIKCVIDSKSMLYLYGLKLDYSDDLIGGGFKFFNPNAESSCGCGSSFGV